VDDDEQILSSVVAGRAVVMKINACPAQVRSKNE
jgi:hypothetical protein